MHTTEEFIETIDVAKLTDPDFPLMGELARHYVEELRLGRYLRRRLAEGQWRTLRVQPHHDATGRLSEHIYDVYGTPLSSGGGGTQG